MNILIIKAMVNRPWVRYLAWLLLLACAFGVGRVSALPSKVEGGRAHSARAQRASRADAKAEIEKSFSETLESLLKNPSALSAEELSELAKVLNPEQARELFAALNAMPAGRARGELMRAFVTAWAEKDPRAAVNALHEMAPSRLSYSLVEDALVFWGKREPEKALKWLQENRGVEPSSVFAQRIQQVVRGWAEKDPQGALNYALTSMATGSRSERQQQSQAVRSIAAIMAQAGDVAGALQLFGTMPEGDLRTTALNSIAREWGRNDPLGAIQWAQTLGEGGDAYRTTIFRSWSESDPAAAAQWLASSGVESENKAEWMAQTVANWSQYDLDAPAQWLNNMPNSTEKDGAVLAFTNRAAREDPETAMAWTGQISNPEWGDRAMAMVGLQWSREDPEGFGTYLQSAQLTDTQRALLQNVSQNGMRAIMQMGVPKTGINGGQFRFEQLRSLGFGPPGRGGRNR